ncbi:thioredoxin domain-containing protein 2-like [Antechinus flavipes]|uniref:thioredoxin domain-containing protein 2-like n=1 Tax=Antechinus flavipes TaxID=38775 RepID=UPI002236AB9D|nr:thioredoxin domain-containing protein 2-like [Antechinus flavipes]
MLFILMSCFNICFNCILVISEENSSEASIERLPEKPGADDSWQNMDDEINFEKEEDSADAEEEEKKNDVLDNKFTVKQKPCENPIIPKGLEAPGTSAKGAVRKRLDKEDDSDSPWDSEEYISDPEVDKKHIVIYPDSGTKIQKSPEDANIPKGVEAPGTSAKGAVRKRLDKEDDSDSPWDSEEYISDPEVDKKHIVIYPDSGTKIQKSPEDANIPKGVEAPGTSAKGAVRKRLDKEDDSDSPWDSEEYISDPEVDKKHIVIYPDSGTKIQKSPEDANIPKGVEAPGTSAKGAVRKRLDKEDDSDSPWDSEEYISDPEVDKKHIVIYPDSGTKIQKSPEDANIPKGVEAPGTSAKGAVRKRLDKEDDSDSPWDSEVELEGDF